MFEGWGIQEDAEAKRRRNDMARLAHRLALQAQSNRQIIRRDGRHVIRLGKPRRS